jgi:hypothetical protein
MPTMGRSSRRDGGPAVALVLVVLLVASDPGRTASTAGGTTHLTTTTVAPPTTAAPLSVPLGELSRHVGEFVVSEGYLVLGDGITCTFATGGYETCWVGVASSSGGSVEALLKLQAPAVCREESPTGDYDWCVERLEPNQMLPLPPVFVYEGSVVIRTVDLSTVGVGDLIRITGVVFLTEEPRSGTPAGTPRISGMGFPECLEPFFVSRGEHCFMVEAA